MARPDIRPIPAPREFGIDELFFSTTDPKGHIRAGNAVFSRVAGYEEAELMGEAHSIVRHPDMPRCIFRLFWQYLKARKTVAAYVKNMAKDGRYYWVVATAMPMEDGYISVRFRPSTPIFGKVEDLYAELLAIERGLEAAGKGREEVMDTAAARLAEVLKSLGYADYDAFMHDMLIAELRSREGILGQRDAVKIPSSAPAHVVEMAESCARLVRFLDQLFVGMDEFVAVNRKLDQKSRFVLELASDIHLSSHNALVASRRLHSGGATLGVVATIMGGHTEEASRIVEALNGGIKDTLSALVDVSFRVSVAKIQAETAAVFISELADPSQEKGHVGRAEESVHALVSTLDKGVGGVFDVFGRLKSGLEKVTLHLEGLRQLMRTLEVLHVTGKVEAARIEGATAFERLFSDVSGRIGAAKTEMIDLSRVVEATLAETVETVRQEKELHDSLDAISRGVVHV